MCSSPSSWSQELGWVLDLPTFQLLELLWGAGRKLWLTGEIGLRAGGLINTHETHVGVGKAESD